jgi:hypothetical protein
MTRVILRHLRQRARLPVSSVTAAFALALFATCLSSAEMTPEQQVCCAAMAHDCGHMAVEASCCAGDVQPDTALAAARPTFSTFSFGVLMPVIAAPTVLATPTGCSCSADRSPLRSPNVPTYLFVSSFRL